MKGLFLCLLFGIGFSTNPICYQDEFKINGYTTGQNIDLDYANTEISASTGSTVLTVAFLVPKVYTEQYEAAAFAITFNRKKDITVPTTPQAAGEEYKNQVNILVDVEAGTVQDACFTNRYTNTTLERANMVGARNLFPCDIAQVQDAIWGVVGATGSERERYTSASDCVDQIKADVPWANVMGTSFGSREVVENGVYTEVFLLATVETWSHFRQTTDGSYQGQMTGNQQLDPNWTQGDEKDRNGKYLGDGGDLDVPFPALIMDDERYTLYQIPFILRFPKSVVVRTEFQVGSPLTLLTAVVEQDAIQVDFNPDVNSQDVTFAALDVTVQTEVQYPYSIRGPKDATDSKMTVVQGSTRDGGGTSARAGFPIWLEYDDKSHCRGVRNGEMCTQKFKMRIVPSDADPCSVAGDYTMEFWADCIGEGKRFGAAPNFQGGLASIGGPGENACSLDEKNDDAVLDTRRDKNGYFKFTYTVAHQSFCPEVMDTVKVVSDFTAYHDEGFSDPIDNDVFSNDVLWFEAVYRTASSKSAQTITANANDDGDDSTIDLVRATKITTTVTIGQDKDGTATTGHDEDGNPVGWVNTGANNDWESNVSWSLGGSRLAGDDFSDPSLTVDNPADGSYIKYAIVLCETDPISADEIQWDKFQNTANKANNMHHLHGPRDCFDQDANGNEQIKTLARDYFDFNKVEVGAHGDGQNTAASADTGAGHDCNTENCIDENEVAFKMRLDERIIPIGPQTDNSHIMLEIEAEVYYKGNRHPTRRLLTTTPPAERRQKQLSIQSLAFGIKYKGNPLTVCPVEVAAEDVGIELLLDFGSNRLPTVSDANQWSVNFGYELGKHIGAQANAIQIVRMRSASGTLLDVNGGDLRRLESGHLEVKLHVSSTKHSTAGVIAMALQNELKAGTVKNVQTLERATVVQMTVPECNLPTQSQDTKLVSSATALSTLFAFVVSFVQLL